VKLANYAQGFQTALKGIMADENGKMACNTLLECDCAGCLRKKRLAASALGIPYATTRAGEEADGDDDPDRTNE
jgi:hypothetical protein